MKNSEFNSRAGGMIHFIIGNRQVHFSINNGAVGLKISFKLIILGRPG